MSGETRARGLIDTSIVVHLAALDPACLPDEMVLSAVTPAELSAGLGWLCATTDPPPDELLHLLRDAVAPALIETVRRVPWPDDIDLHGGLATWLSTLLGQSPGPSTWLAAALAASSEPPGATSAFQRVYELAVRHRPQAPAMIGLLADALGRPDATTGIAAARYLARAGAAPSCVADQVAAALEHPHSEVRAWAAVTLAHCADERGATALADLLGSEECPWPTRAVWSEHLPRPDRLLDRLRPHAGMLLPAVCDRLRRTDRWVWWHGAGWGMICEDLVHGWVRGVPTRPAPSRC